MKKAVMTMAKFFLLFLMAGAIARCAVADTWTEPYTGYTWKYRGSGDGVEIYGSWIDTYNGLKFYPAIISHEPIGAVIIPSLLGSSSVTSIGPDAFYNCTNLSSVTIPSCVKRIGLEAFSGCSGLTNVTMFANITNIAPYAFENCSGLKSVTIPNSVTNIPYYAFKNCSGLTNVTIPNGVISIGRGAFCGCCGLTSVTIGNGVTNIGQGAFLDCSSLTNIVVGDGNLEFMSANGLLLSKDGNTLVQGVNGDVSIPIGVTSIGDYAFSGCGGLMSVTIPNSVTNIGREAFCRCCGLMDVYMPIEMQGCFQDSVFFDCSSDMRIHYYESASVKFDANGGIGGYTITLACGSELVAPDVSRIGYTHIGWSPEVPTTVPASNTTYTAQWNINRYTVTFDANGGTGGGMVIQDYGTTLVAPKVTREWCDFMGWLPAVMATVPANDVTHTAQWWRWGDSIPAEVVCGRTMRELYPQDYAHMTDVILEEGITELPVGFFDGCDNVESLTLPESLETLGYDDLPTKIRASLDYGTDGFMVYQGWILGYDNDGASTLTLPQNAIGIGTRAFAEFWDLETVTIPNTVKRIGREAFFECTFLDDVTIPDSVVTVAHGAFENCSYMQTLSVGSGVRKVADRAFARCASLQAVSFAHGLESVGECAFSNDWRMLSVSLPHSVTNIADGAFAACRRVKGVSVPANVLTLSDMFPAAYSNIESVVVASGETDVMADMFNGCFALTDFTWSGSETNVGARAFFGCEALASVAMPDSVVRIGAAAFKGCSSLRDLTLSRSLVALPDFAFEECGALDSFIVPASVMALGEGFVYESAVSAIYYLGNAPEYDANAATNAYANVAENFITYVVRGTRGWDGTPSSRVLPEDWIGHEITYWTPNRFDVTFDANGGYFGEPSVTQWAEEQITDMGYVLPNQNPVRPGYAFEGWWTEAAAGAQVKYSTQVTATRPHTLYAHWRLLGNLITATFNANGGTVVVPGSQNYVSGQTFGELPVPSRRGYAFCGWWTEASGGERVTEAMSVPAADIELFAHWEPIRYFVAYDANGGTGTMTNQVHVYDAPKALDQNLFSCTGYAFTGWARSADGQVEYADRAEVVNLAEVSNEVVRLYAVWSGAGYNVRFDSNGGTGVMENQTIQIGETQNLHTNAFVFSGREFLGWATESGGTVAYRDGEAVCDLSLANGATVHLYAVWRVADATWRVSFDGNVGSVVPGHWNVARGESLDALPTPTRPGHAFMGWWTQRGGGTSVTPPFAVMSNMTLYAHWRAYDDPLPPVSGDSGVAAVMGDSADLRLGENVKSVDEYNALVEWADENGIGHQAVRTSRHVWASYVLGAKSIFENEPEIVLRDVAVAAGGGGGSGAMRVSVSVTVMDGERAVAVGAAKVAAMFEATSDLDDWNGVAKMPVNVHVVDEGGGNGVTVRLMRFQVTTPVGASRAFLRISR